MPNCNPQCHVYPITQEKKSQKTHREDAMNEKKKRAVVVVANLHLSLGNVLEGSNRGGVSIILDASTVMHL